jgi:hypothetical protein
MAKAIDSSKQILAGLLIFSFLLVILVAPRFMKKDDAKESKKPKEGFKAAPTRAAECKCLPGYVPSKEEPAMEFLLDPRGWGFLQVGDRVYGYWWNMHGIPFDWRNTKHRWVTNEYLGNLYMTAQKKWVITDSKAVEYAPKEIIEQALRQQREGKKSANVYRCQNLNNSGDFKECY